MKKLMIIALAIAVSTALIAKAEVNDESRRMEGINPSLIGITSDEYSDFMSVNTANILDISGYRLYTQLSNLGNNGTDRALAEAATDDELLIGGVMPLRDMGNIGGFLWRNKDVDEAAINYFLPTAADAGAANFNDSAPQGQTGEFESEIINDVADRTTEEESGEAYTNRGDMSVSVLAGLGSLIDLGQLGIRAGYDKTVTANTSREYSYSYSNDGDADDYSTMEYSSEEENYESVISIAPSIRGLELIGINFGGTVELQLVKKVNKTEIDSDMTEGANFGFLILTDDYARTYAKEDSEELSGMNVEFKVDGSYPLNDTVNIKGIAAFLTGKLTGDRDNSWTDEVTKSAAADVGVEKVSFEQVTDREEKRNTLNLLVGIDKQVSEDLLMGIGLGYTRDSQEDMSDQNRSVTNTDGAKAYSTVVTKTTDKTVDSSIVFPVGLEWTATGWLKARLGASYTINYEKDETETVTTTYGDTTAGAKVINENTTTVTNGPNPAEDVVNFYAGVGFTVTDNLTVDVTNMATGNILALNNWEISATLKF